MFKGLLNARFSGDDFGDDTEYRYVARGSHRRRDERDVPRRHQYI